jgi:NADH:ubiquinone oxidoreductase subunit F (NADH-binding)/NADH:ubiquinone oxidoreductase subunit E
MQKLIPFLQELQHEYHYLPETELVKLHKETGIPLRRIHEVASCFPHFRIGEKPARVVAQVCRDMTCHLRGSEECLRRLTEFAANQAAGLVQVGGVSCLGLCDEPLAIAINERFYRGQTAAGMERLIRQELAGEPVPPLPCASTPHRPWNIDPYAGQKPYWAVRDYAQRWLDWSQYAADSPRKQSRSKDLKAWEEEARQKARPPAVPEAELGANLDAPQRVAEEKTFDPATMLLKELFYANLRGMGGAGFPAATKWASVYDERLQPLYIPPTDNEYGPTEPCKYIVCNGDESEPGTFKDRELLLRYPHLVLEGVILAGFVTGAREGYVYVRHEYSDQIKAVQAAIDQAIALGVCGKNILGTELSFDLYCYTSPGGYICGEQSALLAAMMDQRAEPKNKGISVTTEGLYGQPTVVNNVETLAWVPAIYKHGGAWYARQGRRGGKGMRFVSISGDVAQPGVYEIPFGITLGELIQLCGGMRDQLPFTAIALSGPSGGFYPAKVPISKLSRDGKFAQLLVKLNLLPNETADLDLLNLPLDWDLLRGSGVMLGAAHVVYGGPVNMLDQALNCVEFYRNESCGKCVPCRLGTQKLALLARAALESGQPLDPDLFKDLSDTMREASICGLGQVAPNALESVQKYFAAAPLNQGAPRNQAASLNQAAAQPGDSAVAVPAHTPSPVVPQTSESLAAPAPLRPPQPELAAAQPRGSSNTLDHLAAKDGTHA